MVRGSGWVKDDCSADQIFRFGLPAGLECGHAEQMEAVGVGWIENEGLAVDLLRFQQATRLMKRERVTDQGLKRCGGRLSHPAILSGHSRRARFEALRKMLPDTNPAD